MSILTGASCPEGYTLDVSASEDATADSTESISIVCRKKMVVADESHSYGDHCRKDCEQAPTPDGFDCDTACFFADALEAGNTGDAPDDSFGDHCRKDCETLSKPFDGFDCRSACFFAAALDYRD